MPFFLCGRDDDGCITAVAAAADVCSHRVYSCCCRLFAMFENSLLLALATPAAQQAATVMLWKSGIACQPADCIHMRPSSSQFTLYTLHVADTAVINRPGMQSKQQQNEPTEPASPLHHRGVDHAAIALAVLACRKPSALPRQLRRTDNQPQW